MSVPDAPSDTQRLSALISPRAQTTNWFGFVSRRRLDQRFKVFPIRLIVPITAAISLLVLALVFYADGNFLKLVREGWTKNNRIFEYLTHFADSDWILISSGLAAIVLLVFSSLGQAVRLKPVWHRLFLTFYFLFTSVAFSGLLTNLFKFLIGRLRPPKVVGDFPWEAVHLKAGYAYASFPSGHSTTAGAFTMALALLFPKYRWMILSLGVLVASSRSFIGVHFPSDVVAGLFVGMMFTYVYGRSFARKRLLFTYSDQGKLVLRGEGQGSMHRWTQLFKKANKTAKA